MMKRTNLRVAALIMIAFALIAVEGCKKAGSAKVTLPASNEVANWEKTGETKTYTPENLSDYIDGGAEQYLKAGFKSASTSDYKFQGNVEAVADVYVMSNANAAKSIFDADPAGNARTAPLGEEARVSGQSVVFRQGPYLVRIVAYQETPDTPQALTQLAQGIEKKLSE